MKEAPASFFFARPAGVDEDPAMSPLRTGPARPAARAVVLGVLVALLAACRADEDAPPPARPAPTPTAAVQRLLDDLARDDLGAYAVHALPPDLYARSDAAWRAGRSRWPLTELPLQAHLPAAIDRLATPGAEAVLRRGYRAQFAGARGELRSAAATLGLFARHYVEREAGYPADERAHRLQLVDALVPWAQRAPLADAARVEPMIPRLARAARATHLQGGDAAFSRAGMHRSLVRLRPLLRQLKHELGLLGLDIDAALRGARIETVSASAQRARLRLRYRLAGREITVMLDLVRRPEGWFLADSLRHAQAALAPPAAADGADSRLGHNAGDGPADAPALPGRPAAR